MRRQRSWQSTSNPFNETDVLCFSDIAVADPDATLVRLGHLTSDVYGRSLKRTGIATFSLPLPGNRNPASDGFFLGHVALPSHKSPMFAARVAIQVWWAYVKDSQAERHKLGFAYFSLSGSTHV